MRAFAICLAAACLAAPAASRAQETCLYGGPNAEADLACGPIYVAPAPEPFSRAPGRSAAPAPARNAGTPQAYIRETGGPLEPRTPAAEFAPPAAPDLPAGYDYVPAPEGAYAMGPAPRPAPDLSDMRPYSPDVFAEPAPPEPYRGPYAEAPVPEPVPQAPFTVPYPEDADSWPYGGPDAPPAGAYAQAPAWAPGEAGEPYPGPDLSGMRPYAELAPGPDLSDMRPYAAVPAPADPRPAAALSCICPQPAPAAAQVAGPAPQNHERRAPMPAPRRAELHQPAPPAPAAPAVHVAQAPAQARYGPPVSETGPGGPAYPSSARIGDGAAPAHFVYRFETPRGPAYAYEVESPQGPAYAYHYRTEQGGWAQETRPVRHAAPAPARVHQPAPAYRPAPAPHRVVYAQPAPPPPLHQDWRYIDEMRIYGANYPAAMAELRSYYFEQETVSVSRPARSYDPRMRPPPPPGWGY